jgi:hypothetical protein
VAILVRPISAPCSHSVLSFVAAIWQHHRRKTRRATEGDSDF